MLELLDELRWAGYSLGSAQYIAAQDLLLALVACGEDLRDPERFRGLLGPLVRAPPQEQKQFSAAALRRVCLLLPFDLATVEARSIGVKMSI